MANLKGTSIVCEEHGLLQLIEGGVDSLLVVPLIPKTACESAHKSYVEIADSYGPVNAAWRMLKS